MAKTKSVYVCNECGYESSGWLGKCPACNKWNTFFEQKLAPTTRGARSTTAVGKYTSKAYAIEEIDDDNYSRELTGIGELDRVLGNGLVKGSMVLVGGDPGIGKSTLIMQLCGNMALKEKVLYVTGEESTAQIKGRANRLGIVNENNKSNFFILSETDFENIELIIEKVQPKLLIIDSIQTMYVNEVSSAPGSVTQVREVTGKLMRYAKSDGITTIIVGHVTKDGALAGPRVLEHMVDTVLYFEGERHMDCRMLRAVKNRFGSTNEIGVFEMTEEGLKGIDNPSELFLGERLKGASGTVAVSCLEGSRALVVELQGLVAETTAPMPKRTSRGFDYNRMNMLLAVLEKKAGLRLGMCDVFINVVGGLVISEPASDLGVVMALASSRKEIQIPETTVFIGEVGLTGEVRSVSQIEKRILEAYRLGFTTCVIPAQSMKSLSDAVLKNEKLTIVPVARVSDAVRLLK